MRTIGNASIVVASTTCEEIQDVAIGPPEILAGRPARREKLGLLGL